MKKVFLTVFALLATAVVAMAADNAPAAATTAASAASDFKTWIPLAAGFGLAISAGLGALSQAKGLSTALDGIARNPAASGKIVTPMIIGLAMIESLVIYSLVISLMLVLKL
ncbi:MAG: ATP synthase F0 subunit C [Proteobacteria bacterium]|nr:ATP synthase F0 subunit C [Pseudomonadota bacterium]